MKLQRCGQTNFCQVLNDVTFRTDGREMTITDEAIKCGDTFYVQSKSGEISPVRFESAFIDDIHGTLGNVKEFVPSQMISHPPINVHGRYDTAPFRQFAMCLGRESMSSPDTHVFSCNS